MSVDQIKAWDEARPFRRFTIHLADGASVPVEHPEFMWRTPGGRTIVVSQGGEDVVVIDLLLVTRLTTRNGARRRR